MLHPKCSFCACTIIRINFKLNGIKDNTGYIFLLLIATNIHFYSNKGVMLEYKKWFHTPICTNIFGTTSNCVLASRDVHVKLVFDKERSLFV